MITADPGFTPQPMPDAVMTAQRRLTVGVPGSTCPEERRFPLTPEGAGMLIDRGLTVKIEKGAAAAIAYTDARYTRAGARIVSRADALGCDIVISPAPLSPADARMLRRGALLLTLLHPSLQNPAAIAELLRRSVTAIALDLIEDSRGMTPFADILAEIDGRAAIAAASAILADPQEGKGILLGGVAGIVACEVTVIGSGIAAEAAARSALGLGATVRMFDNDVYSLRNAVLRLGPGVIGSAIHPHVLRNALRAADVVIATPTESPVALGEEMLEIMKPGVVAVDLTGRGEFRSLRHCLEAPGAAVGRTAAMALSTTLTSMFDRILTCEGVDNALRLLPGLRRAVYTFMGRVVNPAVARCAGATPTDINIYLTLS